MAKERSLIIPSEALQTVEVRPLLRYTLRMLRTALGVESKQMDGLDVSVISRMERSTSWKVSALKKYAAALGGEIEIYLHMPNTGHRFRLATEDELGED